MPQPPKTVILPAKYYHIYNRGAKRRILFHDDQDFQRFLSLVERYMGPVGMVFAFALMEDHFHLLVGMNAAEDIPEKLLLDEKALGRTFGHIQNAYATYYNLRYGTVSGLFERSYEREEVDTLEYFRNLVVYIHHNLVNHGYVKDIEHYKWTSFQEISTPSMETFVQRELAYDKFGGKANFFLAHNTFDRILLTDHPEF